MVRIAAPQRLGAIAYQEVIHSLTVRSVTLNGVMSTLVRRTSRCGYAVSFLIRRNISSGCNQHPMRIELGVELAVIAQPRCGRYPTCRRGHT